MTDPELESLDAEVDKYINKVNNPESLRPLSNPVLPAHFKIKRHSYKPKPFYVKHMKYIAIGTILAGLVVGTIYNHFRTSDYFEEKADNLSQWQLEQVYK